MFVYVHTLFYIYCVYHNFYVYVSVHSDGFGGLVVSILASGSNPAEAVGFFGRPENPLSMPSFGGEAKESVLCPSFAACKKT